jgi:hypothetical protein
MASQMTHDEITSTGIAVSVSPMRKRKPLCGMAALGPIATLFARWAVTGRLITPRRHRVASPRNEKRCRRGKRTLRSCCASLGSRLRNGRLTSCPSERADLFRNCERNTANDHQEPTRTSPRETRGLGVLRRENSRRQAERQEGRMAQGEAARDAYTEADLAVMFMRCKARRSPRPTVSMRPILDLVR